MVASLEPYGLAETCRVVGGGVPLWTYHRRRLRNGGCPPELLSEIEVAALTEAAWWSESPSRRVRLGITVSPVAEFDVSASVRLSSLDVVNGPIAVRVDLSDLDGRGAELPPLGHAAAKPADRSWWDRFQREAKRRGGHQAIIVDDDGDVVDGGTANVWVVESGRIVTPPAPRAVAGVARAFVLAAAARQGIDLAVGAVSWERFEAADEAFLTNAFGGAVAVRGRGGPAFQQVRALFSRLGFTAATDEPLTH